jgi:Ala-tRNA(Pro) deacylase
MERFRNKTSEDLMGIPRRLIEYLEASGVEFEVIHHPERFTAQELAQVEGVPGKSHAKVVMAASGKAGEAGEERMRHWMAVLPSDRMLDAGKFGAIAGEELRVEGEAEFAEVFPDCETGAMPPFGELYEVPTYVDLGLGNSEFVVFEAGTHQHAIRMRYEDFERLAGAHPGDLASG